MTQEEQLEERNKKIRKRNKMKKIRHYFFVFFTFSLIFIMFVLMLPPKETKIIQGTAIHLSAVPAGKMGQFPKLFIELEDGKKVTASISRKFPFKAGAKVKVFCTKSYLGFSSYSVILTEK